VCRKRHDDRTRPERFEFGGFAVTRRRIVIESGLANIVESDCGFFVES
jgi:hypothetical protein